MAYDRPVLTESDNITPTAGTVVAAMNALTVGNAVNAVNVYNVVNILSEVSIVANVNLTLASK